MSGTTDHATDHAMHHATDRATDRVTDRATTSGHAATLQAEVERLRRENEQLRARLSHGDRQAALLLAEAQEVADSLIEESLHRVERMIRKARSTPPYDGIGEILQLSRRAHEQLAGATSTLAELIERIEQPLSYTEPAPDPLTDRVPFERHRARP
jgi:cell division septum initiation protein DivIVA